MFSVKFKNLLTVSKEGTQNAVSAEAQKLRHNNVTANRKKAKGVCFLSSVDTVELGSKVSLVSILKQVEV